MGVCGSSLTPEQKRELERNKRIEANNKDDQKREAEVVKLLLLGAGESGKSTIFKQMRILYGLGYKKEELESLKPQVHLDIIKNLLVCLKNAASLGISITNGALADELQKTLSLNTPIDVTTGNKIKAMWEDAGFQQVWAQRSNFQVQDSLKYYCAHIDRIKQPNYLPDKLDVLHTRVRTCGIVEEKYEIEGVKFNMYDVGGQRNERKKWIHCFDNVTAVIFVAAINEYDQVLFEDITQNRMDEAISLFDEICNSNWFRRTSMLLFLNKRDLFEDKLFKVPLRVAGENGRYQEFEGPYANDPGVSKEVAIEAATNYMLNQFLEKRHDKSKEVYHHVTCATDTENINVVFNACKDIILRDNLKGSGFMD